MAIEAALLVDHGHLRLDLYPGEDRERVADAPPELPNFDPGSTTWVYYDGAALERGYYEPVGIEVFDVGDLSDDDLAMLARLPFPCMVIRGQGRTEVNLDAILRRARGERRLKLADGRAEVAGDWPTSSKTVAAS